MSEGKSGVFTGGASLVWRRQRVLWWPYLVCLLLAHFAAGTTMGRLDGFLQRSLASERLLVHGFSFGAVIELMSGQSPLLSFGHEGMHFGFVFFFFMLLATGGILEAYWRDATLTTMEFFQNGGRYFWRFFRLVLFLLVALIPVAVVAAITSSVADSVDKKSISPFPAVWIQVAGAVIVLFLLMTVRLWFDIAEVTAVAESETGAWRCLKAAFRLLRGNFGSLLWIYFRISFLAWLGEAILLHIWVRYVPPEWTGVSFVLGQVIVLFWMGMRWWQRASEVLWYQAHGLEDLLPRAPIHEPAPVPEVATVA
jgi:hypothetical protein